MGDDIVNHETVEKLNILLLDDENEILKSLNRVLRLDYNVILFSDGKEALSYLESNEVAIIISDMRMPEMDGADFLAIAKELKPDSVRILLTGYSDVQSTVRAVNEGGIHTYISKPWDNENLKLTVAKAAEFYQLKIDRQRLNEEIAVRNKQLEAMNDALEESNHRLKNFNSELEKQVQIRTKALKQSNIRLEALLKNRNKTFKDILSMVSVIIQYRTGYPEDHVERIANQAKAVALRLKLPEADVGYVYLCGLMHQIGLIGANNQDFEFTKINPGTRVAKVPDVNAVVGAKIVGRLKRFEPLVRIIKHQDELYDGTGKPDHLFQEDIPIGSRIIKVVKDYDFYVASPYNTRRITPQSAQEYLKKNAGKFYDPKVVEAYVSMVSVPTEIEEGIELCVSLSEIKPGMIVKRDLYLPNGNLMVTAGNAISSALLVRLKEIEESSSMPISVYI
ncbi:HD domain-containing phosphohydrolase [Vibrio salinus]|uniref:HD domain-containing phosphohydrolase n=1 Tax=Vibrio salinus TaxID=2899784 RepID=UPI001E2D210F|nr:HD domain-containing phosphohydrolase [Vibrio salinus]MCE0496177.1 response regulator [Vibrio salinus]